MYVLCISPTKNGFIEIQKVKNWYQQHKKSGAGWVGGWMGGRAGLRIAYSNQKFDAGTWIRTADLLPRKKCPRPLDCCGAPVTFRYLP